MVTGVPNHPVGVLFGGYENKWIQEERIDGIRVIRSWMYLTPNQGFLRKILGHVGRNAELRHEIDTLRGELRRLGRFGRIIGSSPAMHSVYDRIERVAPTDTTVLITGETGTGKEIAAHTLHQLSRRSKKVFLPVNCGAVAPTLIESEFFGHERGSFTGAQERRSGIFERADGGTLFLDEITEMSTELQVKLLRVLETGEVTRIGGASAKRVDVRLISHEVVRLSGEIDAHEKERH